MEINIKKLKSSAVKCCFFFSFDQADYVSFLYQPAV